MVAEFADAHKACGIGEDRPEMDRHIVQIRSRPLPDATRETRVYGQAQEGLYCREGAGLDCDRCFVVTDVLLICCC